MKFHWPYDEKKGSKEIVFEDVAGYHFKDAVGSVIFDLEEKEVNGFLEEHVSEFSASYQSIGFPAFWREKLQDTMNELKGYRVWIIDSSIGFDGWIVARSILDADQNGCINSVTLRSTT